MFPSLSALDAAAPPGPPAPAGGPVKLLIVDDLADKRLVYRTVLEDLGAELVEVDSGAEALKQVLRSDFAVILLDVHMPVMDGFETARMIRTRKRSAHTPIIFLTAFTDEMKVAEGYATGAVDYLPTPIVPAVLRAKVRVFIDLFRLRQHVARQAEEQAKRAAAEELARRSTFLANASHALANSLDFEATVRALARAPLPQLADASVVALIDDQREVVRADVARIDAGGRVTADHLVNLQEINDAVARLIRRAVDAGQLELLLRTPDGTTLSRRPAGGEGAAAADAIGSVIVIPLVARGKALGALALALRPGADEWQPGDIALAQELAGRASVALDNALLVRDIQENDRRKNEFLATLSHELRNPLAPIRNALQVIRLSGENRQALEKTRAMLERQVAQLVRLVDDLLDVSRINRNKLELRKERAAVGDIVESAVETSRPLIESFGHRLHVHLPPERLSVDVDPTRLAQVFANLLNNAAKYTEPGGNIWLSVARQSHEVVVSVRDDGIGIPAEALPRVFELFSQIDGHHDRAQGGLGIGLNLARRIVEMHGGTILAQSPGAGYGSEFTVRIPFAEADALPPVPADLPPRPASRHRILVVDDNVDSAQSLGMMLEFDGNEVRTAHDGFAALEIAAAFRPDVMLLDIGMPKLDGYETARRVREAAWGKDVILIAQTGWGQDEDRSTSRAAGFDHHLVKPVDPASLQQLLNQSAAGRRPASA